MDLQIDGIHRRQPGIVERADTGKLQRHLGARKALARRALTDLGVADHHAAHVVDGELADASAADHAPAPEHGDVVGIGRHLAELVADHQDGEVTRLGHAAQEAEHLIGFAGRQHRGRLVEDQEALVEIELLQDFELLLLAGREAGDRNLQRHLERHLFEEGFEPGDLLPPIDDRRGMGARDDEILRRRQRGDQREMLVDHADAMRMRVARRGDHLLLAVDQHAAARRLVEAHDAFDERRLAGAVLAEQRMQRARPDMDRDILQRHQRSEDLGHADGLQLDGAPTGRGLGIGQRAHDCRPPEAGDEGTRWRSTMTATGPPPSGP